MKIGMVINNIWSTRKDETLVGLKLLIVQLMDNNGDFHGSIVVAADFVGAGNGDRVLITQGSSSRHVKGIEYSPVDAVIVGVIDQEKGHS